MARRRSLTSATATALDDSLFHVSQRLDALAADDEHAYLHFSRVVTPPYPDTNSTALHANANSAGRPTHHNQRQQQLHQQQPAQSRLRTTTLTARRRRTRKAFWSRLLGLSAFYARFACLIGLGWFATAFATVATTIAIPSTPARVLQNEAPAQQTAREFAALAAGALLGGLLFGSLGDHYGRRSVLLAASAGSAAAQLASGFAWAPAALLAGRALHGLGVGGQIVLFPIVLSEFAAQRSRGRIVVFGLAFLPLGALVAIHATRPLLRATSWTVVTSAVVGALETLFVAALAVWLPDSPRFLAAVGRVEAAMSLVEAIESAHGINRNARVTMPSSLFEPPAHASNSTSASANASAVAGSARSSVRGASRRDSRQLCSSQSPRETLDTATPLGPTRRRRTSTALTPGMVSLSASLRKRWRRVLFCQPYALRSLGLTLVWLSLSSGLSFAVAAGSRFPIDQPRHVSPLLSTFVSIAGSVGLLFSAAVIDRFGRVPTVLLSLLVSSIAMTMIGMNLYLDVHHTLFLSLACSLLALASVVSVCTAVVWTLESYGVLIRATGMGLAFSGICLGVGGGQWLAWSPWLDNGAVHFVLWAVASIFIALAFLTWLLGTETRGLEDVDSVITVEFAEPALTPGTPLERDNSDKLPPIRGTYHSKDTTTREDQDTVAMADNTPVFPSATSATSQTSTFIGSAGSSARISSVRISSQRTLSSRRSASRGSRGSSLSRQQAAAPPASSSYRMRDVSLSGRGDVPVLGSRRSFSRADQTTSFVVRQSSQQHSASGNGQPETPFIATMRSASSRSQHQHEHRHRRLQDETPRASFGSARVAFADDLLTLPGRLDPHSVREHLGRRSCEADCSSGVDSSSSSSSSRSDSLGLGSDHDVMSIDIDPFEDDVDHNGSFEAAPISSVPMLG